MTVEVIFFWCGMAGGANIHRCNGTSRQERLAPRKDKQGFHLSVYRDEKIKKELKGIEVVSKIPETLKIFKSKSFFNNEKQV